MWRRDAVSEFICDALMWQSDAVCEFIWASTWLCSLAIRFQSIPTIWPLLTTESPSSSSVEEHPTRSRRVMGSNPIWDSDFFRVYFSPRIYIISCCCYFSVTITQNRPKLPRIHARFYCDVIGHVRYINILAWLRGFRVKIENFSSFFCLSIPKGDLDTKKTTPNIEIWPESLGAMSEYWYIERRLLSKVNREFWV